jgi:hypothetical protein
MTSTEDSTRRRLEARLDEIEKAKAALSGARVGEYRAQERIDWLRTHANARVEVHADQGREYGEARRLRLSVVLDGRHAKRESVERIGEVLRDVIGAELFGAACAAQEKLAAEHRSAVEAVAAAEAELARIAGRPLAEAA